MEPEKGKAMQSRIEMKELGLLMVHKAAAKSETVYLNIPSIKAN